MKNSKSLYLLIPLVAIIWGSIAYKVSKKAGSNETIKETIHSFSEKDSVVVREYMIHADYPDPFLRATWNAKKPLKPAKTHQIKNIRIENIGNFSTPPAIRFYGLVLYESTPTAIIEHKGQTVLLKEREFAGDIQILKITNDSITVFYHESKYVINKKI